MPTEGPMDSPEGGEPTTLSAVEPLPPGSDVEKLVDELDERLRAEAPDEVQEAIEEVEQEDTEQSTDRVSTGLADDSGESTDGVPVEPPD